MISILSSLKPFRGDAARLQANALRNWRNLGKQVEILLYGQGEGIAEQARIFGAKHVPEIACSAKGIPRFDAIAEHAARHAVYDRQLYLNGDILLPADFIAQAQGVRFERFLLVGRRIDLAQEARFEPVEGKWVAEIKRCCGEGMAVLHNAAAQDYFVFPRGLWSGLAPLVIGRGGYDNALLAFCLRRRIPIIDASWSLHAVHQWHNYSHLKGASTETFCGEDALANARVHDIEHSSPDIEDADWQMTRSGISRTSFRYNPIRRLEILLRYRWGQKWLSYLLRAISRLGTTAGLFKPKPLSLASVLDPAHS